MAMADPYRAFRQLERRIFRGVPELPEPLPPRDNTHVVERFTSRSQFGGNVSADLVSGARLIAVVTYDDEKGTVSYERPSLLSEATSRVASSVGED